MRLEYVVTLMYFEGSNKYIGQIVNFNSQEFADFGTWGDDQLEQLNIKNDLGWDSLQQARVLFEEFLSPWTNVILMKNMK